MVNVCYYGIIIFFSSIFMEMYLRDFLGKWIFHRNLFRKSLENLF